jgi:UDP:flavonoid glycosyltransferase YjiC (YdhE family)
VPAVIVPFFADQPFWAEHVTRLGVGPAPIPRRRLTAEQLARAIAHATTPEVRARAAGVGREIAAEQGARAAVTYIEQAVDGKAASQVQAIQNMPI